MADASISSVRPAAAQPLAQSTAPAVLNPGAAGVSAADAASRPATTTTAQAPATTVQQPQAAATGGPRDPGPTPLEADGSVHSIEDTMGWLRGQMSRPRVQASASQTQTLAQLHQTLLDGYKTMIAVWTSGG